MQDRPAQGRRRLVEGRHTDVRRHDRANARVDRRAEWNERRSEVAGHDRKIEVRIDLGVAVPREVLGTGGDAGGLHPGHEGGDVPRHELRVRAERADADHRVPRVRVHVGDRPEVEPHPYRGEV